MKKITLHLFLVLFVNYGFASDNWTIKPFERKAFIENKGQFNTELPHQYQQFDYCIDNQTQILFNKQGLTYVIKKQTLKKLGVLSIFKSEAKREESEHDVKIEYQYITMKWLGSNSNCSIETVYETEAKYNYMLKGIANSQPYTEACKGYKKIIYKNIYNGIDIEYFFTEKDGFKYNIIAQAGADLSIIKMQYDTQAKLNLTTSGDLKIKTITESITEKAPVSYLSENTSQKINSSFLIKNNIVSFNINNAHNQALVIDPIVIVPTGATPAFDNGVDNMGNIYLYGGSVGGYTVEKYSSSGALLWSLSPGVVDRAYYGDLLVDGSGDFYICEGYRGNGARTHKFTGTSAYLWTSTTPGADFREHWRIGLDCKTGRVIVIGGGTQYTMSIAEISVATGVLTNIKGLTGTDLLGLVVDGTGKSCVLAVNDQIVFTDATNNNVGSVASGYGFTYQMSLYTSSGIGYNCMALGGSNFLFTSDGATVKKWNRTTSSLVSSAPMPGGVSKMSSGIYVDGCSNVFVGSANGVYRFDVNLVQQEFLPTSSSVFDVAFAPNGDIIASGAGFATNLTFNVPPCIFKSAPVHLNSCGGQATGYIKLNVTGGVPTYNYSWFYNGAAIAANTDSIGGLAAGIYKCVYTDSPCTNPRKDSATVTILSVTSPTANFNFNPVCIGSVTQFTNLTTPTSSLSSTLWSWDWENDGTIDNTTQDPSKTFLTIGNHVVKLKANINGCIDSINKTVIVYINPTPKFTVDSVCFSTPSHFADASNGNGNPITNWAWDFDNDALVDNTLSSPNYSLSLAGNNTVNFTVTTTPVAGLTCSSDTSQTVWVRALPQAAFSFINHCINAQPNTFDASGSSIAIGTVTNYAWNFGDTQTSNLVTNTTTHTYGSFGLFPVTLTLSSDKGCIASVSHTVEVYQKPIMSIAASPLICLSASTTFTAISAANSGNIVLWQWDLNNSVNTFETIGKQSSFAFPTPGTHTISLVATTDNGCKDTIKRTTYINYIPVPNFTVDKPKGCPLPHCVTFTDNSTVTGPASITYWNWNFGNNSTFNAITNANQQTCYNNSSSNQLALYTVTLTTKTDSGCVASEIKKDFITVYPKPIANYTITPNFGNVVEPRVEFTNQSIDYTYWYWTFGDSPKIDSSNLNPSHYYNTLDSKSYPSMLIVKNQYGCVDTSNVLVDIAPDFVFYIPNAFSPNGDGINEGFTGTGIGIVKYEMWIYDRWGTSIYYTDDINKPWNGKVQGKSEDCKQDVYAWIVELKDVLSKKHNYVGHVTLLR